MESHSMWAAVPRSLSMCVFLGSSATVRLISLRCWTVFHGVDVGMTAEVSAPSLCLNLLPAPSALPRAWLALLPLLHTAFLHPEAVSLIVPLHWLEVLQRVPNIIIDLEGDKT